jgi:hypothetical protein
MHLLISFLALLLPGASQADPAPGPKIQSLCTISFLRDKDQPRRVDSEAKACLDDVALNMQRNPDSTLVLIGNATTLELLSRSAAYGKQIAASRAVNTKGYIVLEKGLDASRIQIRTGYSGSLTVGIYLVPAHVDFEKSGIRSVVIDEAALRTQQ